jgi:hypothetical protein
MGGVSTRRSRVDTSFFITGVINIMHSLFIWVRGNFSKLLFIVSFFYTLVLTLCFGVWGMPTEMGFVIASGGLCMIFTNLDKIVKFKGAGFEVEFEKLEKQVSAKLETVQRLSTQLTSAVLETIAGTGYGASVPMKERVKARNELYDLLISEMDITEEKADNIFQKYDNGLIKMHARNISSEASRADDISDDMKTKIASITGRIREGGSVMASPEEFSKFMKENNVESPEILEAIEDLKCFVERKELRRPEIWNG